MENNLENKFNFILTFLLFTTFFLFSYILNTLFPYDIFQAICHIFITLIILLVFFTLKKKNCMINELNETLDEKDRLSRKLEETNKKLEELASKDSLTGIGNRRYYFDFGEKLFSLAKRDNTLLSLITMDIDNFKNINDKFGHQIGDEILKLVSSNIISELRKSDISARVGGEEFSIVLPNTDLDKAISIAEKIRIKIKNIAYKHQNSEVFVTGSFGVSQIITNDNYLDDIFARADKALYKAKSSGKNRVCYA